MFRANLIAGVAAVRPDLEVKAAAGEAATHHAWGGPDADAAAHSAQGASRADTAAEDALHAALYAAIATRGRADAMAAVEADRAALEAGRPLESLPLWPTENELTRRWPEIRERVLEQGDGWAFWVSWYDKALTGRQQDWKLLADIALIPPEDWDEGMGHVNAIIAALQLKHAVARTPNAEVIFVNEKTGRLRAKPITEMPTDHLEEATEKLGNVVALFDPGSDWTNQYRAIDAEREIIAQARERYARRPRMLHSSCVRVIRRLDVKIRNGECPSPEQDADIADFYGTVLAVSVDLYERDPLVREAVDQTATVRLRDATPAEADTIVKAADEVAALAEGDLAEELPEQARAAVDPATPSAERKEALYVTISRLLRSGLIIGRWSKAVLEEIESVSKTVAGICKNVAVIAGAGAAVTTPLWLKSAVNIILSLF